MNSCILLQVDDPRNKEVRKESWKILEDFYEKGTFKAIGVSNYNIQHLQELLSDCKIKPHVNQVEVHPHYPQKDLLAFCKANDIHVTAYSSLGTTQPANGQVNNLIKDPVVTKISENTDLSNAQVLLLWGLQKDLSVVPKSVNPQHIIENIELKGTLSDEDMDLLDSIEIENKYAWSAELVV